MALRKSNLELADVIRKFGKQLLLDKTLSAQQIKALNNIVQCRTASLGGHEEVCDCCNTKRYSYNSCRDRHCPKCLGAKQADWVDQLTKATMPVKHYHIVFTVPHCLNDICLWNEKLYYKILFASVWHTLRSFGYTHYGSETGAIAMLHSWGQNLSLHPHIHCIVPAVGYSLKGEWKHLEKSHNYLYPVHQLSSAFKGKFLDSIKRKLKKENIPEAFKAHIERAYNTPWVVHCEASMANDDHVIKYLGQYTHRVAITNQRILNISDTHVTFIAKDYRDKAQKKPVSLTGIEFLKRFCLHVLRKGFVKIRRYGIYNHTTIRNLDLEFKPKQKEDIIEAEIRKRETPIERLYRLTGFDAGQCPACKKGRMHKTREIPRIRSPAMHLPTILMANLL